MQPNSELSVFLPLRIIGLKTKEEKKLMIFTLAKQDLNYDFHPYQTRFKLS
jgi:hypothetical protein